MPTESRVVATRFGDSHVLLAGREDAAPVVVLGGGNVVILSAEPDGRLSDRLLDYFS